MKKRVLIWLLLPLALGCKKDPDIPYCELHPDDCVDVREVKEYFYFSPGSYWVYEEEGSGKTDSVFIIQTYSDTESYYFSTKLHSTYDGHDYRFWTNSLHPDVKDNMTKKSVRATSVWRSKTGGEGGFDGEAQCFPFYPEPQSVMHPYGGEPHGYNNVLKVSEIRMEYTILDFTFNNVVQISEQHTWIEESQQTEHYYSKGIGLIRKELIDSNQVWNLVNYHIEN